MSLRHVKRRLTTHSTEARDRHERAVDTPESLRIVGKSDFKRETKENVDVFINAKEGLSYTFINSRLRTTRFSYSEDKLARETKGSAP